MEDPRPLAEANARSGAVHFHALVLDGVHTAASAFAHPVIHALDPPSDEEVEQLLATLRRRILRLLAKRGRLDDTGLAPTEFEERTPAVLRIWKRRDVLDHRALLRQTSKASCRSGTRPACNGTRVDPCCSSLRAP